ncbi:hypothetical protein OU416_37620 [Saccharopolyspora indica]|uniref:hypothetical protein n=1 Tax=Saccharopolyspora indica TaxID=1229659 RepID=UPI0022EA1893|nr:hypothetical protein [Saccharopolyspora indica]MDA3649831.1 hypothetical protein [Saccharopolyspora indica]
MAFEDAFPGGALALSEVEAANERQSPQDRSRGVPPRQRVDLVTGLPVWKVTVSDPSSLRPAEAAVAVEILAAEKPELPEPVAGMAMPVREVRFTGMAVEPKLGGQDQFRFITYTYRAEGIESPSKASGPSSGSSRSSKGAGSAGSESR